MLTDNETFEGITHTNYTYEEMVRMGVTILRDKKNCFVKVLEFDRNMTPKAEREFVD